ncbi:anti-sigma factor [Tropicibacter sp. R15_0]|uniref:anti-sigma factor family protein n=1 Tax=Tropicibacter sp. R15_0 TaxID=2821101 RepID=UPI001ADB8090|nr:anti-sigma factor [Tropicibacter sp. R15_0]MBO9465870.1 anti-sigma factor [Tropicibacter sp. R15_0]
MSRFENDQERLSAYLDGEMTPEENRAFEVDLENNPELAEMAMAWADTEEALRDMVPTPSQEHLESLMASNMSRRVQPSWMQIAAALALVAFGAAGGFGFGEWRNQANALEQQAVFDAWAAHRMFTAENRHAVEVAASETEHLQTWLSKRMGREMTVPQLTDHGMVFVGGRMLPFQDRAAAQYMYENAQGQRMTLFMTKLDEAGQSVQLYDTEQDETVVRWQDGEWLFVLVAPMARGELSPIATGVQDRLI